jgi:hypothetical protein
VSLVGVAVSDLFSLSDPSSVEKVVVAVLERVLGVRRLPPLDGLLYDMALRRVGVLGER